METLVDTAYFSPFGIVTISYVIYKACLWRICIWLCTHTLITSCQNCSVISSFHANLISLRFRPLKGARISILSESWFHAHFCCEEVGILPSSLFSRNLVTSVTMEYFIILSGVSLFTITFGGVCGIRCRRSTQDIKNWLKLKVFFPTYFLFWDREIYGTPE